MCDGTRLEPDGVSGTVETLQDVNNLMFPRWVREGCAACLIGALGLAGIPAAAEQPPDGEHEATENPGPPPVPPGAIRLINYARHGKLVAICAEEPGPVIDRGGRLISRTRVWVGGDSTIRQVATEPGTCDPAWSPEGARVVVAAPDGLWVFSSDLRVTVHLVDTRHVESPANEFDHRTLSKPQWSPDASSLAFLISNGDTSWVEVVNARTGEVLYNSEPEIFEFTWGVDSRSLRFGSRVARLPDTH